MKKATVLVEIPQDKQLVIWAKIRELCGVSGICQAHSVFTVFGLSKLTKIDEKYVERYVGHLSNLHVVVPSNISGLSESNGYYQMQNDPGVEPPRFNYSGTVIKPGTQQESIWRTIRILNQFTEDDVVSSLPFSETPSVGTLQKYLKNLLDAGYISNLTPAESVSRRTYRLNSAMNKGPMPPQFKTLLYCYDPNLNDITWPVES